MQYRLQRGYSTLTLKFLNKSTKQKVIKIEKIITDEAYLEYYKKERELLLGLIDSFD